MASPEFHRALRSISAWAQQARTESGELDLAGLRDATDGGFLPVPEGIEVEELRLPREGDDLKAEWVRHKDSDPRNLLLYLHGGGYLAGGRDSHRPLVAELVRATSSCALVPEYRLAPEHPFPAGVDDAILAYDFLLRHLEKQNRQDFNIWIAGDSAGGGLTLACMLAAKERGLPMPNFAVTMSAYTDCALEGESVQTRADVDPVIGLKMIPEAVALYLNGADPKTP